MKKYQIKVADPPNSFYCPDSCESLYGGQCIMRIDGVYNGGFPLYYDEQIKLGRRYIRRQDCRVASWRHLSD